MDIEALQIQALITFLMPLGIQLAKRSRSVALAWINPRKPKISMLISGVGALATAMGIQLAHTSHSVTLSWPDSGTLLRGLLTFLVSAIFQFAAQHALYEGLWRNVVPATVDSRQLTVDSKCGS